MKEEKQSEQSYSYKRGKFIQYLAVIVAVLCAACMTAVFLLDPFYHYHKPWFGLKAVLNEKEYQVPGSLRHFDYDTVLVGSSVVENNNNRWYDEAFGGKTIKAVRSYGGIADLVWYLDLAFSTHEVKQVFFNIDPSSLTQEAETTFKASGCPMYLYDENPFNDVQYLLNKTVILEKIPYMLAQSFSPDYDEGLSYNWAEGKDFSEEGVLSHYYRTAEITPMVDAASYEKELQANIDLLVRLVQEHPDTEFTFFLPPYSMIWWDDATRHGMRDVYLYCEEKTAETLLSCRNVKVFDFQNETSIVTNLNLYMDTIHFSPEINYFMCRQMAEDHYRIDKMNAKETFEETKHLSEHYEKNQVFDLEKEGRFLYEDSD